MILGLQYADLMVVIAYLGGIAAIGAYAGRQVRDTEHYFLGKRSFGKLLMMGQSFGVGTHAEQPVVTAGACFRIGLAGIWYQWKYIFCTPFYWLIAPIFRRLRFVTSAEYMEVRYGKGVGLVYTGFALVFFLLNQSAMLLGAAKVISITTGGNVSNDSVIYAMTAAFVVYSFLGGLVSAAVTDVIQSFLIIVLSGMLLPAGLARVGGFNEMRNVLTEGAFDLSAPTGMTVSLVAILSVQSLLAIFAQPHIMASVGTGKTESNCRVGFTYGNLIKRFCTLGWALVGLIVAAMAARGMVAPDGQDPECAFGLACRELLGPGFLGLMIACVLAANMSTCSAFMVDMGALFVQNVYKPHAGIGRTDRHCLWVGRLFGSTMTVAAVVLTFYLPGVLAVLLHSDSMAAFMGIPFIAGIVWKRANRHSALVSFVGAVAFYLALNWCIYGDLREWRVDAFMYSLFLGTGLLLVVALATPSQSCRGWSEIQSRLHMPVVAEGLPADQRDLKARQAEDDGEGLLLVDILSLHHKFSLRRYRSDVFGFLGALGVVGLLLAIAWAMGNI